MHRGKLSGLLKYFPTPRFLKMPAVGFEVTPEAVRVLELVDKGGVYRVGRFGNYPLEASDADDDNFLEGDRLKEKVLEVKNKHKLSIIAASLPDEKAYIFRTEVPRLSVTETRESVELKLEEYVPLPPREAVFDYQIIDNTKADRVLISVSVVPRLVLTRYLTFFQSVDLMPVSLQIASQAAAQAVIPCGDDTPTLIVNFGARTTSLSLVLRRQVYFTSTVAVGGSSLTDAIKKYFSVGTAEAEKLKREQGIMTGKKSTDLFFSMASTLSALKEEIEKLMGYWETHIGRDLEEKRRIERVMLVGVEGSLPRLTNYLEASLGVSVLLANVWTNAVSFETYIPPIPREESLAYASVIGLSLHDLC